MRMMHAQFVDFPTPRNINYLWTAGALLSFCLAVQILTGIVLAMHYAPTAADAFNSVEHIRRDVNFGWLIRNIHAVGASMFFLAVYIHIGRGLYYGSYKAPREVLWIIGVVIFLLMMATAFMGYSLPWGQMSFWAVTVITNLFSSLDSVIPGLGTRIVQWLWGGYSVSGTTLTRFFSLHYLLPFVIVGAVVLHIWALHVVGQNNPTGLEIKTASDSVPMAPHAVMKDTFALAVFVLLFAWFVFYLPDYLGHADNYIEANPLSTPPHIVPEWYFLPYYAILRAIPNKLLGVIAMFSSIILLCFAPWLDTSRVRSAKYRPVYKWFFWLFIITVVALGYLGSKPAEGTYVMWARIFTAYYFMHFLIVMPIVGVMETPTPLPRSITESVLGSPSPYQPGPPPPRKSTRAGERHVDDAPRQNGLGCSPADGRACRRHRPGRRGRRRRRPCHHRAPEVDLRRPARQVRRRPAAARLPRLHGGLLALPRPVADPLPQSRRAGRTGLPRGCRQVAGRHLPVRRRTQRAGQDRQAPRPAHGPAALALQERAGGPLRPERRPAARPFADHQGARRRRRQAVLPRAGPDAARHRQRLPGRRRGLRLRLHHRLRRAAAKT